MKNQSLMLLPATLIGGLLFTLLFWEQWPGLNILIFNAFIISMAWINPSLIKSKKLYFFAAMHGLICLLVVFNKTQLSLSTYIISLILYTGFSHQQALRSIFMALLWAILQFITAPFSLLKQASRLSYGKVSLQPLFKLMKYAIVPCAIAGLFTLIYSISNDVFAHYVETLITIFFKNIEKIIHFVFKDLSIGRFMHFCFGVIFSAGLLITLKNQQIIILEQTFENNLSRLKTKSQAIKFIQLLQNIFGGLINTKKMVLKAEYVMALSSFIVLNILLFALNCIDVTSLWFGYQPAASFSADVHQGTNSLIFSILLAMLVIVFFFRGNLNFYPKSKNLRLLANFWMVQNLILIISVFIKVGYYVQNYGLTHKRIGVIIFAFLCIIGLFTVYIKVKKQKTCYFLLRINTIIWFGLILALSTINWDVFIVKYNIAHAKTIQLDTPYLLSLSDSTLPILDQNRQKLSNRQMHPVSYHQNNQLNDRIDAFKERYAAMHWLSWNLNDYLTAQYFQTK